MIRIFLKHCFFILLINGCVLNVAADYSINSTGPITIGFKFNEERSSSVTINVGDIYKILAESPLPENVYVDNYKIDIWTFAALQKLKYSFVSRTSKKDGLMITKIIEIDNVKNNEVCEWMHSVNNLKSKYAISTQSDSGVKIISFLYACDDLRNFPDSINARIQAITAI